MILWKIPNQILQFEWHMFFEHWYLVSICCFEQLVFFNLKDTLFNDQYGYIWINYVRKTWWDCPAKLKYDIVCYVIGSRLSDALFMKKNLYSCSKSKSHKKWIIQFHKSQLQRFS